MSESVVLCEGFHDRAFWAGWLEHLGCTNLGQASGNTGRIVVTDPSGNRVTGGQFAFRSASDKFVRLVPCRGDARRVRRKARLRLDEERQRFQQEASTPRLTRLVLNVDTDVDVVDTSAKTGFRLQDLGSLVDELDPSATNNEQGDFLLFDRRTTVSLVRWEAAGDATDGVPSQQTLERLVCSALMAAYSDRGPAVQQWLDGRPAGSAPGPKEFAWSYMAGWYAKFGCEGFYKELWRDDPVAEHLKVRLKESGAWRVAEALAE
ncbi:MAG: hypothetical protein HQ567_10400 [Candidatus Nealsonbacteria bacterium]|nr:hypothetical protein [Candidatus Nealsonbacteria bacterium]